ncbi:MAG: trehalase family glycosidase [Elusimicrobiales bacterium]|nr:trehalase family glycosidase [Elusimicrobiales bacterium]
MKNIRVAVLGLCLAGLFVSVSQAKDIDELTAFFKKNDFKSIVVKPPKGILKHTYLVPDGPYTHLFDWDMYFMGVAFSYDGVGKPVASSVKSFLEFVNETANWPGYAPREIAPDALWALPEMCKPFLAQAAQLASRVTGDASWLLAKDTGAGTATNYEKLAAMLAFWEDNRKAADGLFRWYNGVESGVDNNPAVSDNPSDVTEGVDLQCYLYREYLAMSALAEKLGKKEDAAAYAKKAADLKALTLAKMWSEKDGTFYNIDSRTGEMVKIKTWTNFTPLWVKIASPEQAKRMIEEHLLNEREFWSPNGVRTIAITEPFYNSKSGYWRGPVWIISDYLMMHGLLNYGYKKEALELANKTVSLLTADLRVTGGMNENYNPETGAPLAGGHFLSWNLLAEHMIEEAEKGTDPAAIAW